MYQTKEEKTAWLELVDRYTEYHQRQLSSVYRSTVFFCDWLESLGFFTKKKENRLLDIGAGQGANLLYMSKRFKCSYFTGIEINADLVKHGNEYFSKIGQKNCILFEEDLYKLDKTHIGKYNGVISFQTLSWLPEYKTPIRKMVELKPEWIAISSLFFEGRSNCQIIVNDYTMPFRGKPYRQFYSNIYSIPLVKELFFELGYSNFKFIPFDIDIDLSKPETEGFGTYTERLEDGRRLQISGPLLMPWYFILAWI